MVTVRGGLEERALGVRERGDWGGGGDGGGGCEDLVVVLVEKVTALVSN